MEMAFPESTFTATEIESDLPGRPCVGRGLSCAETLAHFQANYTTVSHVLRL
jgi:hypothetical protein